MARGILIIALVALTADIATAQQTPVQAKTPMNARAMVQQQQFRCGESAPELFALSFFQSVESLRMTPETYNLVFADAFRSTTTLEKLATEVPPMLKRFGIDRADRPVQSRLMSKPWSRPFTPYNQQAGAPGGHTVEFDAYTSLGQVRYHADVVCEAGLWKTVRFEYEPAAARK